MKTAIVVAVIVIAGALVILGAVVPAMENAKTEALAIGEEAGKVMSQVDAFYAANGRFPLGVAELRLPGTVAREYRVQDAGRRVELVYAVRRDEVTIQHESGKATFAAVLEQGKVAGWQLKDTTYSSTARGPIEFGAMSAVRCLGDPAAQPLPDCARFRAAPREK